MKTQLIHWGLLTAVAVIVVFVLTGIVNRPADAALGNQGVPVRCYSATTLSPSDTVFLTCVTPSGQPSFVGAQRVPAGYYFLLTDVFVTPVGGTAGDARVDFYLYDAYGTSGRSSNMHFRSVDGHAYGEHFTAPMYVLPPDHRLEVQAFAANQQFFDVRFYGLLVNNVTYLPTLQHNY